MTFSPIVIIQLGEVIFFYYLNFLPIYEEKQSPHKNRCWLLAGTSAHVEPIQLFTIIIYFPNNLEYDIYHLFLGYLNICYISLALNLPCESLLSILQSNFLVILFPITYWTMLLIKCSMSLHRQPHSLSKNCFYLTMINI